MIHRMKSFLRRFRRNEEGGIFVVEFVIYFPLLFGMFLMSCEMGLYSMRHMFLDRGLDITVRHIRLNTNTVMTHSDLKDMICENAGFLTNCENTLRLEMTPMDPRQFVAFEQVPECSDETEAVRPVTGFSLGMEHQMMVLRACWLFDPVFPTTGLGYALDKQDSGHARMISTAVFVQEPN